ncbi:hypothetical protein EDD16DRAFT_1522854 [Pisolithus croceorrhizus]|nr:hypothetical protein EDD16DRAFT_1522854 [Pisolithus croceorrhizus]
MQKSERPDANVSETRNPDLITLLRHKTPNNSATANARATSRISSGRYHLGNPRLKEANDSARNCMSYDLSEVGARRVAWRRGDRDAQGELGERGIGEKRAPVPKISAKLSHTPLYAEKTHISTTNERILMKEVSPELNELWPNHSRGEEAALHQGGTAEWNSMKLREVVGTFEESWENKETGETAHPIPRYSIFLSYSASLQRMGDISRSAEAAAAESTPLERARRVDLGLLFVRGLGELWRDTEVGHEGG